MVTFNHQRLVYAFLLLLFSSTSVAEQQLIMFIDKSESVIGRPIRIDLYAISLKEKISEINLRPLKDNFGVVTDYIISETSDNRWPGKLIQIMKLKLYPRKTGNIIIPRISSNGIYSSEKKLNITKGKPDLPEIKFSVSKPFERQQIYVTFTVKSTDSTSRLSLIDTIESSNFESIKLPFKRIQIKPGIYQLQTGLSLSALKSGTLSLELPPIEYSVSGVSRKKFYFPIKNIIFEKLPSYLLPTIPIGKVSIQSKLPSQNLLKSESIYYWNVKIKGLLNSTYELPAILRQLKSNSNIKFFPAESIRSTNTASDSLISVVNHSIPFKILNSGITHLPELRLQYYDPSTGKIERIIHKNQRIFSLDTFWRITLSTLAAIFVIYLIQLIFKKWCKFNFSKKTRERAILLLSDKYNTNRIRKSISLLAQAEYWHKNITITQWELNWSQKYQTNEEFRPLLKEISLFLYSSDSNIDIGILSDKLIKLIDKRKSRKRFFHKI